MANRLRQFGFSQRDYDAFLKHMFPNKWISVPIDEVGEAEAFVFVAWMANNLRRDVLSLADNAINSEGQTIRKLGQETKEKWEQQWIDRDIQS